jgi:Tol biopolymer transport system component
VRRARSLAFPLALTNVAFVVLWFVALLVLAALVIGSPTTSYENGYRSTVLYLAAAAAVTSALVTLAWLDRRHVCRAYEQDASIAFGSRLVREIGPILLAAGAVIGLEVVVGYGRYATVLGAPNPPTRGMVAYAHSFDEYAIHSIDADGSGLRQRLDQSGPVSEPVESPGGKLIAFTSNRDGSGQIYLVEAEGRNERKLTDGPRFNIDPAWSPDGRHIAFSSARDGNPEIYVMSADGTGQRRLTANDASDENPSWSPDGTRIAFTSDRDGNDDIYVMRSDGGGAMRITNDTADDRWAAWSPDDTTIAFTSDRDGDDEIYLVRLRDRKLMQLTRNRVDDNWPTWSPDGRRLAFVSDRGGVDDVWVTSLVEGGAVNYTNTNDDDAYDENPSWSRTGRITFAREIDSYVDVRWIRPKRGAEVLALDTAAGPAWSPDGERIAVTSDVDGEIYLADADLTYTLELPGEGWNVAPDWSPDGTRITFVSDRNGRDQIYVMTDEGGKQRQLTRRGTNEDPAWSPDGRTIAFASDRAGGWRLFAMRPDGSHQHPLAFEGDAVQPAWSPTGRRLAFTSDLHGSWEIYVADADGTRARRITRTPVGYDDTAPTWSSNGRRIAFDRAGDDGSDVVYLVAANGGKLTHLGRGHEPVYDPDWQPPRRRADG